ncbi:MAG: hypothetical protein VZR22_01835 [Candidatus Cryptobacteroides sp.]|nr:hypothetical protein [Candidatus Cryptobacteroides sp.]
MEENFDALEVIARTRGKVDMDKAPTGESLFLLWGTLTAGFFLLQFVLWELLHQPWCLWVWAGAVLIGWPWMILLLRKDHNRTHCRTHEAKVILDIWVFIGAACAVGGFIFGLANLFELFAIPLMSLLVGIGAFVTGEVNRFRPKIIGGLSGAGIGIGSFVFQEELWAWQMLALSVVSVVSLVIPGFLYKKSIKDGI